MKKDEGMSLFESTLSPVTSRYINSKYQLSNKSDILEKMDLRHMCEKVVAELESVEKEAAFDYLKVEKDVTDLNVQLGESDQILGDLEKLLLNFRDHLNEIKTEMTNLQERSLKMNTCLHNRKNLQKLMNTFMDSAVLEPQLIEDICNKEINEQYVDYIRQLCQKLEYLAKQNLSDSSAVRELEPELNKLKSKACARVRSFLIEKLHLLKKPKTNIQIMQNNVLMKYRIFTQFLREHYLEVYVELCNIYSEIMGKIYFTNFKTYISEINKLMIELFAKQDTILNENSQMMRGILQTRGTNLNQLNRSIFFLMERDEVLSNMEQDPIIFHVTSQANRKILLENFFKSVNKLLLDSAASEFIFTLDFFNLKSEQNKVIFEGVFRETMKFILDNFKSMLSNTFDIIGLLLVILLNEKNKKQFNSRGLNILDSFFEQINMLVWPRFELLFEQHLNSLKLINMKTYKILERSVGIKLIVIRFIDFSISLYKLYAYFEDNKMLWSRMVQLRTLFFELMRKSAREFPNEYERTKFLIEVFDSIFSSFYGIHSVFEKKEFQEDLLKLEKELNGYIDQLVELYLKDYFGNLIDFVRKYAREEIKEVDIDSMVVPGGSNNEPDFSTKKDNMQNVNVKLIEHINNELNDSWNKRIDSVKNEAEKTFPNTNALKLIIKKFLTNFLAYYNSFFKHVKNNYPSYLNSLIPLHLIMKEVKASMKKYNI